MTPGAAPPLFIFGTLRDDDILRLVLGGRAPPVTPAVFPDHEAVRLGDETFPVLARAPGASLAGGLLALSAPQLARIAFYEGEEYRFETIHVDAKDGETTPALVCAEREARPGVRVRWSLADWQRDHKAAFVPRVREYMKLFGQMSAAEADVLWRAMSAQAPS